MTDPWLPPISVPRGGIRFGDPIEQLIDGQRLPAERVELDEDALVAYGGLCAPVSSMYDIVDRTPWTHSDLPWCWDIDVDRWLFPRLFRWQLRFAELRRRLRLVRLAIAGGDVAAGDSEDDAW